MLNRFLQNLRFPYLFLLAAVLLGVDIVVPDLVPFVDEILLAAFTVMLGVLRSRRQTTDDETPELEGAADDEHRA